MLRRAVRPAVEVITVGEQDLSPGQDSKRVRRSGRPYVGFGRWLAAELDRAGLTGAELARRIGTPRQVVYGWLHGLRPSAESCQRLADQLGVPVALALKEAGHIRPASDQANLRQRAKVLIDLLPIETVPVVIAMLEGLRQDRAAVLLSLEELTRRPLSQGPDPDRTPADEPDDQQDETDQEPEDRLEISHGA